MIDDMTFKADIDEKTKAALAELFKEDSKPGADRVVSIKYKGELVVFGVISRHPMCSVETYEDIIHRLQAKELTI